jgi:hypothetical protein
VQQPLGLKRLSQQADHVGAQDAQHRHAILRHNTRGRGGDKREARVG